VTAAGDAASTVAQAGPDNWTSPAATALDGARDAASYPSADAGSLTTSASEAAPPADASGVAPASGVGVPGQQQVALAGTGRRRSVPFDLGPLYIVVAVAGLAGALLGGVFKVRTAWNS